MFFDVSRLDKSFKILAFVLFLTILFIAYYVGGVSGAAYKITGDTPTAESLRLLGVDSAEVLFSIDESTGTCQKRVLRASGWVGKQEIFYASQAGGSVPSTITVHEGKCLAGFNLTRHHHGYIVRQINPHAIPVKASQDIVITDALAQALVEDVLDMPIFSVKRSMQYR